MIRVVKREIAIEKKLRSKIEWACTFSNCVPKIKNGNGYNIKYHRQENKIYVKNKGGNGICLQNVLMMMLMKC